MRKLRFESLELLSLKERRARRIDFHPRLTVIKGENDVGKSSIIKSIYWALGATSAKIHPTWSSANIKALLTFRIDQTRFRILRDHNNFGVFDADDQLLLATDQTTKGLAPFLGKLLNFNLVLPNRTAGGPEIPPPAYAFLPFYIDQDAGWARPLSSFANLEQYGEFRRPLLEFHMGIRPHEHYELDAEKRRLSLQLKELEADHRIVVKAIQRFSLQASFDGLELSVEGHESAVDSLLLRLKKVRGVRQDRATKLSEILDQRMAIDQQIRVVKEAIGELEKDAIFAGESPEELFCPTCGTSHQNDFANRYGIVEDREACFEFLAESGKKIRNLTAEATRAEREIRDADQALWEIQNSLEAKEADISLLEVIESRGRHIASSVFEDQLKELDGQIAALHHEIANASKRIRELNDKSRRDRISTSYAQFVLRYLRELDVTNFLASDMVKIPAKVSETGSDLPRALLANFLAVVGTIYSHSTALFAPIIVDSPNQQDQDATNVGTMIDLIIAERPNDAQTILGTVSLHGRHIQDGDVIELAEKNAVLRSGEYKDVGASMQPFFDRMSS